MTVGPFQPICGGTERIHLNVGIEWEYESHPTSPHVTMQFECALQSHRLGLSSIILRIFSKTNQLTLLGPHAVCKLARVAIGR